MKSAERRDAEARHAVTQAGHEDLPVHPTLKRSISQLAKPTRSFPCLPTSLQISLPVVLRLLLKLLSAILSFRILYGEILA